MEKVDCKEWNENVFKVIGDDWMLLTEKAGEKVNTMTASWGGLGIMWGKQVAFIFIRTQRYTKEFVDQSDVLSISVLPNEFRKELGYLGKVSGRDEDKITKAGLHIMEEEKVPYFEEARLAFLCKKLYVQDLKENCFIEKELIEKWYPNQDFHYMYVVEITKVLQK